MIVFYVLAIVAFLVEAIFSLLPCGTLSDTCSQPFLALPDMVNEGIAYFASSLHFFVYMLGDGIGGAIVTSLNIIILVYLATLVWQTLLYFRVPIVSNLLNVFRANVEK